jgi:hypothetical protein
MIVKLDWEYPPYLRPLAGGKQQERVRIERSDGSQGSRIDVVYDYAHQEGKPEGGTIVRLYGVSGEGPAQLLVEQTGVQEFHLPRDFAGNIRASVVPCCAEKQGEEYFSNVVRIGDGPSLEPPIAARTEPGWK